MADATLTLEAKFLDQVSGALKNIEKNSQRLEHAVNDSFADMDRRMKKTEATAQKSAKSFGMLGSAVKGMGIAAAAAGFYALGNSIKSFSEDSVKAALDMQKLDLTLGFATGSAEAGQEAFAFIRDEANRLGLDLQASATGFSKFAAATKGTAIEGQAARDVFVGVAEAAAALQLGSEETRGALTALEQMVSKGTVSAEELRGQLGERIPGAFNKAAAAMGVTTKELNKMLQQGEVMADDFLPKFAKQLHDDFGGAAVQASREAGASFRRFNNAILETQVDLGEALIPALTEAAEGISSMVEAAKETGELQKFFDDVTTATKFMVDALMLAGKALKLLNEAADKSATVFIAKKWGGFLAGLAGLKTGSDDAKESVDDLRESFTDLGRLGAGFDMTKQFGPSNLLVPENKPAPVGLTDEQIKEQEKRNKEIQAENEAFEKAVNASQIRQFQRRLDAKRKQFEQERDEQRRQAKEIVRIEEEKELQIIQAQANLAIARAEAMQDPLQREIALLELHMNEKLEKVRGNEEAITTIKEEAELRRLEITKRAQEEESQLWMDGVIRFTNDVQDMLGGFRALERANQQSKIARLEEAGASKEQIEAAKKQAQEATALAKTLHKIAIFETLASTYAAATKALDSRRPFPLPQIDAAGRVAAGLGNLAKIKAQQFARGTQFAPGGTALVGERGPELLELPRGTRVNNAAQTKNIRSNATLSAPITINIQGSPDRAVVDQIGQAVGARLKAAQRELEQMDFHGVSRRGS